jgi:2-iminobutanoate/2-iminopropanoate deaminase
MLKLSSLLVLFSLLAPLQAAKKAVMPPGTAANRPFSPGILADGTLYISGITGSDAKTGAVPADFESEVKATFSNIEQVLKAAGMTFDNVVAVQVYLTDISMFQRMNAVYTTYFKAPLPTRTTVGVAALAGAGAHIEITMTAHK